MKRWCARRAELDDEIYGQLVDQLFGTVGALIAAVAGSLAMASAGIVLDTGLRLRVCLGVLALACLARGWILLAYRRVPKDFGNKPGMIRWEALYAITAIAWMAAIGCDAYFSMLTQSMPLRLFASIMAMGLTGGIAARNASRPWIVKVQIIAVLGPYSIALLQIGGFAYQAMFAMSVLMFAGVASASETIHRTLLSAMNTAKHNRLLAHRLDTALNNMSHGLIMLDNAGEVELVNAKFERLLGIAPGGILPKAPLLEVVRKALASYERPSRSAEDYVDDFYSRMQSGHESELLVRTANGVFFNFSFHPALDGGSVILLEDSSEKRLAAEKIERLAHYDSLTELPNRAMFKDMLSTLVTQPTTTKTFAVHFLDLDNFKQVNDTLGHPTGDALLAEVSLRIKAAIRADDFCARLAGDEFVVVQRNAGDEAIASRLASRLIEVVSQPYCIDVHEVVIGVSIGIFLHDKVEASVEDLLKHADLALYSAKQNGKGTFCFFKPMMIVEATERRNLEQDLRCALRADELDVFFQPIVDLELKKVVSFEALVRWHHPKRGLILPDTFIKLAEATGLIAELGAVVLRKACQAAMTWPCEATVSVNLSVVQFRKGVVLDQITEALAISGLPPERLEVEVTESLALDNLVVAQDLIGQLRKKGIRVALDDFGTGYSSLAYLQQIPFDKIKIDRSFVRDIIENEMSRSLVKLMTSFAKSLDKTLVVEGVETVEQANLLRNMGVAQMQGFLFGRPEPRVDVEKIMTDAPVSYRRSA